MICSLDFMEAGLWRAGLWGAGLWGAGLWGAGLWVMESLGDEVSGVMGSL